MNTLDAISPTFFTIKKGIIKIINMPIKLYVLYVYVYVYVEKCSQ